jgi:hypothetical protein
LAADASTGATAALSETARLATGAVGLLVGRVTFTSERGSRYIGLGGRVVEVTSGGLVKSEQRYTGAIGQGLFVNLEEAPTDVEAK